MKQSTTRRALLLRCAYSLSFALTLCCMTCHNLSATEKAADGTEKVETFTYDTVATEQLKGLYCNTQACGSYQEGRIKLQKLVKQEHADPNVVVFGTPLLSTAIMQDDYEFTELLLKRGALVNGYSNPLFRANTPKMARLLLRYKADINACEQGGNLLHDAARNNKPAKMVAFLCNAGVDCTLKNRLDLSSPVHTLFDRSDFDGTNIPKKLFKKITIFLWAGADLHSRNKQGQSPLGILKNEAPDLVPHIQARMTVIPQIKSEKKREYQQNLKPLLASHITTDPAGLVVAFMGQVMPLPYHKSYLPEVERRVAQELAAAQKSIKRSRSQSSTKTSKK